MFDLPGLVWDVLVSGAIGAGVFFVLVALMPAPPRSSAVEEQANAATAAALIAAALALVERL